VIKSKKEKQMQEMQSILFILLILSMPKASVQISQKNQLP
jgi:hypothetical protein